MNLKKITPPGLGKQTSGQFHKHYVPVTYGSNRINRNICPLHPCGVFKIHQLISYKRKMFMKSSWPISQKSQKLTGLFNKVIVTVLIMI